MEKNFRKSSDGMKTNSLCLYSKMLLNVTIHDI